MRWKIVLGGCLAVVAACAAPPAAAPLPFDVRPTMTGLRADALAIARALEHGELATVTAHVRRLESTRIGPDDGSANPEFDTLAGSFASSAHLLRQAIDGDDVPRGRIAFSQLLQRCDACHDRFRATAR